MSQTPTTPLSPTPLNTSFFNVFMNNNASVSTSFLQQQDGLVSPTKEEISTIFVVGFPEDMQEREFQNMFMFSPGFEAATLKVPSKDGEEEFIMNGNNGRKQIIGFAKFRTRKEAIDARDILNGRKVDNEKNSMLKAEMAKKNLHTKRGFLTEQPQPSQSTQIQPLPQQQPQQPQPQLQQHQLQQQLQQLQILQQQQSPSTSRFPQNSSAAAYEAFYSVPHPVPNELMSPNESYSDFYSDMMSPPPDSAFSIARSQSVDARSMDLFVKPSVSNSRFSHALHGRFAAPSSNIHDGLDYLSKSTPTTDRSTTFQAMNTFFANNPHNHSSSLTSPTSTTTSTTATPTSTSNGLNRVMEENNYYFNHPHHESIITRFHPLNSSSSTPPKSSSPPPPPGIISPTNSYRSLGGMLVGSSNPADQNPPCNTLYVGNLPPNTNEDELKAMFSKCAGYKRLSFRNKSNGPMCFVEFEDAIYAAQALQELHGNPLSNSIKGGIRLSFSKNPLGVRQNPANSNNSFSMISAFNRRESITTSNFDPQLS
ncbi:hypothetical protein CU098_009757 [Rhizopus stolonifer]|uniref:RRM domain-containing protein n=1 Tax=Rhizopus stolonifer TaxID=4846 RepID=A0A367KNC7_RHIST|nr:hypothetical protein CU098_009757 [Rhizopus stolonifer]